MNEVKKWFYLFLLKTPFVKRLRNYCYEKLGVTFVREEPYSPPIIERGIKIKGEFSNNGVYNAEENTITWDVDGIVAGAVLYLSYDAEAPVDLDGTDLIGYSSIVSNEVASAVVSENTIVSAKEIVDSSNPNTSYLLPKSIFFFEIVFFIVLLVLLKMKVKKTL